MSKLPSLTGSELIKSLQKAEFFVARIKDSHHILIHPDGRRTVYISITEGYISHELHRCVENRSRYILLAKWNTLEAHTEGFRKSTQYLEWRRLLHHYYDPFPTVEHYTEIYPEKNPHEDSEH